jgi:hypothetical protein
MMSRRIARLCLALAVAGGAVLVALVWDGSAQSFDRNDRAAVLRALNAVTGQSFDPQGLCIVVPEHFPDLVVIESVVPDAGCLMQGVFVRGRWQHGNAGLLEGVAHDAFAARGWASASAEARRTMAMQWVSEVVGGVVVDPARLDLRYQGQGITAPTSEARPDGGVIVRAWVIRPTVGGPQPSHVTFLVGPDGTPGH